MLVIDHGGKDYAKGLILRWLRMTGGSNANLLEVVTGLPPRLLGPLLAELMTEGDIALDKVIFKLNLRG